VVRAICDLVDAARSSVDAVYGTLDRAIRDTCGGVDAVTLWQLRGDRFVCVYARGARYEHFGGASLSALRKRCPLAEAWRNGSARVPAGGVSPLVPADRFAVCIALAGVPLVVYVAQVMRPSASELQALSELCVIAARALSVATERAEDHARATYDALTGLLGPRAFRNALAEQIRRAPQERVSPRLVLAFVDTDRFKEWNDRYGHTAGDDLLRQLAGILRAHASAPEDLVARNGGDEFCLVWFDCEKSTGIERAEKLRATIQSVFREEAIPITVSIGVAAYPIDSRSPEGLLEAADAAMYEAKRAGRNRVWFAGGRIVAHGPESGVALAQP
jgi:diguanylate cyclase (GGDEF)-like protein